MGANIAPGFSGVPENGLQTNFKNSNVMAMLEDPPCPILVKKTYYWEQGKVKIVSLIRDKSKHRDSAYVSVVL